jgi:recombination protein RecA
VKIVKNKIAPPFKEVEFDILYNEGISQVGEIIDLGLRYGIIDKAGAWYAFRGERVGQGRDNAREFLKTHADMREQVKNLILDSVGIDGGALADLSDADENVELESIAE